MITAAMIRPIINPAAELSPPPGVLTIVAIECCTHELENFLPFDEPDENHDDGNDEQDMDESPEGVGSYEA